MRHRVYGKHLSRTKNQRTALFKSLVQALILSEKIETTQAKAKAIKGLVDRIITQSKSINTQRLVTQFIISNEARKKLFDDITPRLKDRNSGYTSIVKLGKRQGDGTEMVQMSFLLEDAKVKSTKKESAPKVEKEA